MSRIRIHMIRKIIGSFWYQDGTPVISTQGSLSIPAQKILTRALMEHVRDISLGQWTLIADVTPGRSRITAQGTGTSLTFEFDCLEFLNRGEIGPLAQEYVMRWATTEEMLQDPSFAGRFIHWPGTGQALATGPTTLLRLASERLNPEGLRLRLHELDQAA